MKKLLLLLAAGVIAGGVNAQEAKNLSLVRISAQPTTIQDARIQESFKQIDAYKAARNAANVTSANKTTATNQRVYNWSDYLKNIRTMTSSSPYMWFDGKGMGIYSAATGGGYVVDTISLVSYGMVIAPWYKEWNDVGVPGYTGQMVLNQQNTYTVDSIVTYGFYGRNASKTGIVDTMIFALAYGPGGANSSVETVYYPTLNNGDTLRCLELAYDTVNHRADTVGTGAAITVIKLPLTVADSSKNRLAVYFGKSIPANNFVGVSITFKTGDPAYVPYTDTVFAGPTTPNRPFKFGMWRPAMYEENAGQSPTYIKGNQNTAQIKGLPDNSSYVRDYIPTWAYVAAFTLEWSDIDFVLSSSNPFSTVGVGNVSNNISGVNIYPNPATSEVNIKFTLNNASNTNVTIKNTVGQVIATQNMGNVANGMATFSTANLSAGVYFCTVESNGQHVTSRFVVAH